MSVLLLTSSGEFVTENTDGVFEKPLSEMNIAYIDTASKRAASKEYSEKKKDRIRELGWNFTCYDIAGMKKSDVEGMLKDKDAVYVEGGNTFYLLKCVRESEFDKVIKHRIQEGLLYIVGSSAEAYITCPTIEMATWKKRNPPFDQCGITDLTALNLVPFLIFAHYEPKYEELLKEKTKTTSAPVKTFTDTQALLVKGEREELLSR